MFIPQKGSIDIEDHIEEETSAEEYCEKSEEPLDNSFTCDICEKSYPWRINLKRHIQMIHERIIKFKCELCDYGNYEGRKVKIHLRQKHGLDEDDIIHFVRRI